MVPTVRIGDIEFKKCIVEQSLDENSYLGMAFLMVGNATIDYGSGVMYEK